MGTFHLNLFTLLLSGLVLTSNLPQVTADEDTQGTGPFPCGGTANGTIILPANMNVSVCIITVERKETDGNFTTLTFSQIDLKGKDSLFVYDGNYSVPGNQVLNTTGSVESLVVVVASLKAYLVVTITANNSASRLKASYNTTNCEISQSVSGSDSRIQSPVFLARQSNFTCDYSVQQEGDSNTQLALSFLTVNLDSAVLNVTANPKTTVSVSGTTLPSDLYSRDISMTLTVSNASSPQSFQAVVAPVTTASDCGTTKVVSGSLKLSITVPELHPLPYDCRIVLKADKGKSLWMNITSLQLADNGDSLTILDGTALAGSQLLTYLLASTTNELLLSSQSQVLLRLVVGEMLGARSLTADVVELDGVGHVYNSGNFLIPAPKGTAVATQYFLMETNAASVIKFTLDAETQDKTYNYNVRIYDGSCTKSPLLVTFSDAKRVPVVSSGNMMLIVAEIANTSQFLNASFVSQKPGCDTVTSAAEGSWQLMTSPTVPSQCTWTITAPPKTTGTVLFDITTVKLEKKASLSIYSGVMGSAKSLLVELTAADLPQNAPLSSIAVPASQWAQVIFSSGSSSIISSVAINVRYQTVSSLCGGEIQAPQGRLRSPAFPNLYPLNSACTWTLPEKSNQSLLFFHFPQFQLAEGHTVSMEERRKNGSSQIVQGGGAIPDVLYATNVTNDVVFSAPPNTSLPVSNQTAQGFDAQYWVLKCGNLAKAPKGEFSTPQYPTPLPLTNPTLCVWLIQLPQYTGKKLNIMNVTLQLKLNGIPSVEDMVKMFDGDSISKPTVPLNTSNETPFNFLSRYNSLIVMLNISTQTAPKDASLAMHVNYTIYSCNRTCGTKPDVCMHPHWVCNGQDDCGNNADEQNCSSGTPQTGMKPGIVVVLFFVGLLIGIVLALVIPRIIRRVRTNRYKAFNNENPSA